MSAKNQKNLIAVGGVVVALLIGTVLLGGFAKSEPPVTETNTTIGACPATGSGGCPMAKADAGTCAKTCDGEKAKACPHADACPPDCPKPCCVEKASEGCCEKTEASACCSEGTVTTAK